VGELLSLGELIAQLCDFAVEREGLVGGGGAIGL
jgi:hypothetical protein